MDCYDRFVNNTFISPLPSTLERYRLSNNGAPPSFKHAIRIDLSNDRIEVPVFLKYPVISALQNKCDFYVHPIVSCNGIPTCKSSYNTAISALSKTRGMIMKMQIKEDTYYGCPGIILDGDCNIMLVVMAVMDKDSKRVGGYKCLVSRHVFEDMSDPMTKALINKIIPGYSQFAYTLGDKERKLNITIGDIPDLIISSKVPRISDVSNENLNNIIARHLDDIVL